MQAPKLAQLFLDHNRLTGRLTEAFLGAVEDLTTLSLTDNVLTGQVAVC